MKSAVEFIKNLWHKSGRFAKSSVVALILSLIGSGFALWHTFDNVATISQESGQSSKSPGFDTTVLGPSLSEVAQQMVPDNCMFKDVTLQGANGQSVYLSDADWVRQHQKYDATYFFKCIDAKYDLSISITSYMLSAPGTFSVEGWFNRGQGSLVQLVLQNTTRKQESCWSGTVEYKVKPDSQGDFRFIGGNAPGSGFNKSCDVVAPSGVEVVSNASTNSQKSAPSTEIDAQVRKITASNCAFVAAVVADSYGLPESEDKTLFDYVNNKSINSMSFGGYGPSASDYKFDPFLNEKVALQPTWINVCGSTSIPYTDLEIGGFIEATQNGVALLHRPFDGELFVSLDPGLKNSITARINFQLFNSKLQSCGKFTTTLATYKDVDDYYRWNKTVMIPENVHSAACSIIAVTRFSTE